MARNFNILREHMSPERRARVEKRVAETLEKMALHESRPNPGAPPSTRKRQGGVSRVVAREGESQP